MRFPWKLRNETRQIFCRCLAAFFCRQPHNMWFGYLTFIWPTTLQNATCRTVFILQTLQLPVECLNSQVVTHFFESSVELFATHYLWKMRSTYFTSALIIQYNRLNVVHTIAFCSCYQRWNVMNQMRNRKKVRMIKFESVLKMTQTSFVYGWFEVIWSIKKMKRKSKKLRF